ncbi:hypothetical protein ACLOJK_008769 [Asimina triloba]
MDDELKVQHAYLPTVRSSVDSTTLMMQVMGKSHHQRIHQKEGTQKHKDKTNCSHMLAKQQRRSSPSRNPFRRAELNIATLQSMRQRTFVSREFVPTNGLSPK